MFLARKACMAEVHRLCPVRALVNRGALHPSQTEKAPSVRFSETAVAIDRAVIMEAELRYCASHRPHKNQTPRAGTPGSAHPGKLASIEYA